MVGNLSDFEIFYETELQKQCAEESALRLDLKRKELDPDSLPVQEWRPKKIRRIEDENPADERSRPEWAEREKCGRELVGLMKGANLPFARAIGNTDLRVLSKCCCQGLGRSALKKRIRQWHQYIRYLRAHDQPTWVASPDWPLRFLQAQVDCGAPKTWFTDFGRTLKLIEISGEQDEDLMIH